MKKADQHSWTKTEEGHVCKTCGCTRTKEWLGKYSEFWYARSGIQFGFKRPDCLDWNDNTLD